MLLKDLIETHDLRKSIKFTMPPTYTMPALPNSDAYLQYRHSVALASARSDIGFSKKTQDSTWGEHQTVVCYVPDDVETLELANKIMGIEKLPLTDTPSQEAPWRNTVSPVRKFVDITENQISHRGVTVIKE